MPRARAVVGAVATSISSPFCAKSKKVTTSRDDKGEGSFRADSLLDDKGESGVSSWNWFEVSQVSKGRPGIPFDRLGGHGGWGVFGGCQVADYLVFVDGVDDQLIQKLVFAGVELDRLVQVLVFFLDFLVVRFH